jgi:predicted Ser/Thr protein kinase
MDSAVLETFLKTHLTEDPGSAAHVETRLNMLRRDGLLSAPQHASLTATVRQTAAPEAELPPGTVIRERFVLEEVIGRGGMSVVYRARDRRREEANDRNCLVAIKVLGKEFRNHPDAFVTLQREARRAQQLAHPNINTVYDFDREDDTPYLCMELLTGRTLDQMRSSLPLGIPEARHIIAGMAGGLQHAHDKGIVHADFKPSNVFITTTDEVKILDFGIARVLPARDGGAETTFDAGRLGAMTPAYASCEMFERREPDPRDDVYALACVSYELLTGEHPFQRTPAQQARDAGLTPAPMAALSKAQNRALQEALAFDRQSRTGSAMTFYERLFPDEAVARRNRLLPAGAALVLVAAAAAAAGAWLYLETSPTSIGTALPDDRAETGSVDAGEPASAGQVLPEETAKQPTDDATLEAAVHGTAERTSVLDEATSARMERILRIADLHRQVGKLVAPPGTNAAEAYAEVLTLQPGNVRAQEGLSAVADALVEEVRMYETMGDRQQALELVSEGLRYAPGHQGLLDMEARLSREAEPD